MGHVFLSSMFPRGKSGNKQVFENVIIILDLKKIKRGKIPDFPTTIAEVVVVQK